MAWLSGASGALGCPDTPAPRTPGGVSTHPGTWGACAPPGRRADRAFGRPVGFPRAWASARAAVRGTREVPPRVGFRGRVPRVPVRRLHARVPRASRGTRAFELPVGFAPSGYPGAWPSGAPGSVSAGGFPWARVSRVPARDLPARVSGVSARPGFRGVRSPRARARGRRAEVSDPGAARRPGGPVVRRSGGPVARWSGGPAPRCPGGAAAGCPGGAAAGRPGCLDVRASGVRVSASPGVSGGSGVRGVRGSARSEVRGVPGGMGVRAPGYPGCPCGVRVRVLARPGARASGFPTCARDSVRLGCLDVRAVGGCGTPPRARVSRVTCGSCARGVRRKGFRVAFEGRASAHLGSGVSGGRGSGVRALRDREPRCPCARGDRAPGASVRPCGRAAGAFPVSGAAPPSARGSVLDVDS